MCPSKCGRKRTHSEVARAPEGLEQRCRKALGRCGCVQNRASLALVDLHVVGIDEWRISERDCRVLESVDDVRSPDDSDRVSCQVTSEGGSEEGSSKRRTIVIASREQRAERAVAKAREHDLVQPMSEFGAINSDDPATENQISTRSLDL